MAAKVAVCVPVYKGAAFVRDVLAAIQNQSHRNLEVLISVDRGDDDSLEICRAFMEDRRFQVFAQQERLGWVRNTNYLLDKVNTEYFCLVSHDDLIHTTYVERLLKELSRFPEAAAAFSDICAFGLAEDRLIEDSLTGGKLERVMRFLSSHFDAVAFRGVVRRSIAGDQLRLRENACGNFGADTIWNLELAFRGTLQRVAEPLYIKRLPESSEHHQWKLWTRPYALSAWIEHCAQCAELVLKQSFSAEEQCLLLCACMSRTVEMTRTLCSYARITGLGTVDRGALLGRWMTKVLGIALGADQDALSALAGDEARPLLAEFWAREAEDKAGSERLAEAEVAAREAVRLEPNAASAHAVLSRILAQRGVADEALEFGQRAIELSPGNPHLLSQHGGLLAHLGRAEEAQRYHAEATRTIEIGTAYRRQLCTVSAPEARENGKVATGRKLET